MGELEAKARMISQVESFKKFGDGKEYLTIEDFYKYIKYEKDSYEGMTKVDIQKIVIFKVSI